MSEPDESARPGGVQSVDRALQILDLLSRHGQAGVSLVAAELDIHKSTASRLLAALEARGMVEQAASRGTYQLGVGLLRMASGVSRRLSIVAVARPILERLADEFGETINLAVRRSRYAVNVDQAMGPSPLASHDWIGNLTPLHATASGKVFLAALNPEERSVLLGESPLTAYTPATITDREQLARDLQQVAATGLATTRGELETGLNAVAVAVRDFRDEVVASISVSGPAVRFEPAADSAVARALRSAGDEVSRRLGRCEFADDP